MNINPNIKIYLISCKIVNQDFQLVLARISYDIPLLGDEICVDVLSLGIKVKRYMVAISR